ncbi:MAG TPA: 50S ribosomal protein L11 methyltransferase [Flavisolibacter sp.]|nr:50S ribosomal protein L11 methyltransferase [Flavisolibacter sp.]
MNSIQVNIEANEEQQEILVSLLEELHANGFEQMQDALIAYFPENNFESYEVNEILKPYKYTITTLEEQNWNKVWESNFEPVIVEDFCAIRAEFHQPFLNVAHEIVITPKMSFGTGHHATTYMMIQQMKDIDFAGKTVFDFGTGTGILAILAEKLGSGKIHAIDIDEWSIENTIENINRNGCSKINVELSTQLPTQQFDIILANINRNVILEYLAGLMTILQPVHGQLLLSGLLVTDEDIIVEACVKQGLRLIKKLERNNWISLLFVNGL